MKKSYLKFLIVFAGVLLSLAVAFVLYVTLVGHSLMSHEYRQCESFVNHYRDNMSKQKVLDKLGYPDLCYGEDGFADRNPYLDNEQYKFAVMQTECVRWRYEFYKYKDSDPCWLDVCFDENGKTISVDMDFYLGG